jgi:hypothetical protein
MLKVLLLRTMVECARSQDVIEGEGGPFELVLLGMVNPVLPSFNLPPQLPITLHLISCLSRLSFWIHRILFRLLSFVRLLHC